ncbi:hypothetical protein J7T55_009034 [Diaporthe amygdali]|uniref:uncharacterized protein n=1 Tax=Phomopsis amygdali TaxID=1214568 RepID=UPI0022FEFBA0|nr:uncharacterized protein J7T55_009034 [Diaporthe amygdali]KAJ0118251.1 hypothetical protein J7T55_009034 [Diaporthe amygdali]
MASLSNRCGESKSPYVRAHKDNPTAWQLWTPETLALAKRYNKLLFVSIGYSACHWCHVMAHESFDDPGIALFLNEKFVPVKIDREERPDIDRQYMDFVTATTGHGGWPLNVFVTPDLEPIFGGTYWPGPNADDAGSMTFQDVLTMVSKMWAENEAKVRDSGKQITEALRRFAAQSRTEEDEEGGNRASLESLIQSYQHYKAQYDGTHGGFGGAPKFPTPANLTHLLRLRAHGSDVKDALGEEACADASKMVLHTLQRMARGGIKDQVGNGFARYSVTQDWSLPHFEKMLYDNAQLLPLYLDAYLLTREDIYLDTAHDIAKYLTTSPMSSEQGGIHASEDADSAPSTAEEKKKEGAFYVWDYDELDALLEEDELLVCARYWNIKHTGNVDSRHDIQGELTGMNTLCVQTSTAELAESIGKTTEQVEQIISQARAKMLKYRNEYRPRPDLDDKIVTAWNGMAISGLARTSAALEAAGKIDDAKTYLAGAEKAASFIREHLFSPETNTLRRVYREGPGDTPGFADDYAYLISGLIDLYEATFDDAHLEWADTLQQSQIRLFWDAQGYGFFSTPADQPDILVRSKDAADNAEPGINGVSAWNLLRLGSLLDDATYEEKGRQTIASFGPDLRKQPAAYSGLVSASAAAHAGLKGVVLAGDGKLVSAAIKRMHETVRPGWTVLDVSHGTKNEWLRNRNQLLKDLDGSKEVVQLCEGKTCRLLGIEEINTMAS